MLFNAIGMMGETVVLGWLTLELTNSPLLVGVAMGMRMLPLFFVGVPAGALADRFPRHQLLMLTGAGQALTASALGALTLLGPVGLAAVLLPASGPPRAIPPAGGSLWASVVGFATAMRTDRPLLVLMMLTAAAEVLGFSHQALLPSLARDVLAIGPEGLGALNAARAV